MDGTWTTMAAEEDPPALSLKEMQGLAQEFLARKAEADEVDRLAALAVLAWARDPCEDTERSARYHLLDHLGEFYFHDFRQDKARQGALYVLKHPKNLLTGQPGPAGCRFILLDPSDPTATSE